MASPPTYDSTPREPGAGFNPLIAALRGASTAPAQASGYKTVNTPWATNTPNVPYTPRFTASTVNRDPVPKKPDDVTEPDPTPGTEGYWEDVIIPAIEGFGGGGTYRNWVPGTKAVVNPVVNPVVKPVVNPVVNPVVDPNVPLTQRQGWEKMVTDYTIARNAAGQNDNAFLLTPEGLLTPAGQSWVGTRDTNIANLTDINLLNKYKDEFKLQSTRPGVESIGASGYANALRRLAQLSGNPT